jgi:hypothetical protein
LVVHEGWTTCNTALASWLELNGLKAMEIDGSDQQNVKIVFPEDTKRLRELVRQFQLNQDMGCCSKFFSSYKSMVNRVKAQANGNGNGQPRGT